MSGTVSYWESSVWRETWDLIIVGAGITGSSAAIHYLEHHPKAKVLLLERAVFPSGASTRNAGFTCFGTIGESLDDLAHETEDVVFARIRRRYDGLKLLQSTIPAEEMGHVMTGGHELFVDSDLYERCVDAIPRFNARLKEISGRDGMYAATKVNGQRAISIAEEGHLHSGKLLHALHRRVKEAGGDIRWNMPVEHVESGVVRLATGDVFRVKRILLATNGFTGSVTKDVSVNPARGQVLILTGKGVANWRGTWHFDRGFIYWRDVGDALLLGGARNVDIEGERTMEDGIHPEIQTHLLEFARKTLGIKDVEVRQSWSGIMGFPEKSKTPIIEDIQPGVWLAAGLGGMGVALGVGLGRDVVKRILNGKF